MEGNTIKIIEPNKRHGMNLNLMVIWRVKTITMRAVRSTRKMWSMMMYTKDGRKYYQNNRTKQTSWNEPQSDGYMEGQNDNDAGSEKHEENVVDDDDGKAQS
eukprot:297337_1